ncbi:30S ribosomal protein S5 [Candidatus Woesearchaeota archaeon]|nr:30S ribosomal protein S5 [Candidatus Woesearchaeota archaeon]
MEELSEVETPEEVTEVEEIKEEVVDIEGWKPKTELGRKVKKREITDIDSILDRGNKILEVEIVDSLIPGLKSDLLLIGQAKGKFGGGQRRVFKQTQKKTKEGNKPKFGTYAVVGNGDGIVGVGYGKSKETVPAREKAIRNAKLGIFKIRRGCGSWACGCKEPHSIPFEVRGKCGSSQVILRPAPKGTGLVVEKECQKILKMAGIKDVFSKTFGQTKTKTNLINACIKSLRELTNTKINPDAVKELGIVDRCIGAAKKEAAETEEEKE